MGRDCDAILVQGFQWAALQYLYRGPTDVQGFHCDAVFVQRLQMGSSAILEQGSSLCAGVPMGSTGSHAGLCVLASKLLPADLFLSPSLEPALKLGDKHRK